MAFALSTTKNSTHLKKAGITLADIEDCNRLLNLAETFDWARDQQDYFDQLVYGTQRAIDIISQYGVSEESLSIFNADGGLEMMMEQCNTDDPLVALEEQQSGIWAKIKAFFKELWNRICNAFKALCGNLAPKAKQAEEVKAEVKQNKPPEEFFKKNWGGSVIYCYTPEQLKQLHGDFINCIHFMKVCNELDFKKVISTDPAVYEEFERKFVTSANAIFGIRVTLQKEETLTSKLLPFSATKSVDNDTKKIDVAVNFAEGRGKIPAEADTKMDYGYKSDADIIKLCEAHEEFIAMITTMDTILERLNKSVDQAMVVFEEESIKIIPGQTISKIRALLSQIPRCCSNCMRECLKTIQYTTRMVNACVTQLKQETTDKSAKEGE